MDDKLEFLLISVFALMILIMTFNGVTNFIRQQAEKAQKTVSDKQNYASTALYIYNDRNAEEFGRFTESYLRSELINGDSQLKKVEKLSGPDRVMYCINLDSSGCTDPPQKYVRVPLIENTDPQPKPRWQKIGGYG